MWAPPHGAGEGITAFFQESSPGTDKGRTLSRFPSWRGWTWNWAPPGSCLRVTSLSFQFIVYEVPGQDLEVDLYDEDPDRDDFLGR